MNGQCPQVEGFCRIKLAGKSEVLRQKNIVFSVTLPLNNSARVFSCSSNLTIDNLNLKDSGEYACYLNGKLLGKHWLRVSSPQIKINFNNDTINDHKTIILKDSKLLIDLQIYSFPSLTKLKFFKDKTIMFSRDFSIKNWISLKNQKSGKYSHVVRTSK